MVARLLAQNPRIALLDEPVAHLDLANQVRVLSLAKSLVAEGLTVVAVLHDPNQASMFGEEFIFLKEGRVKRPEEGKPPLTALFSVKYTG